MDIIIHKPVLCKSNPDHHLLIYDDRGILFFSSKWAKHFRGYFSLPKGKFETNIDIRVLKPLKRRKLKLKIKERDKKHNWDEFKIKFAPNPNKCTINHTKQTITFDDSFKESPKYQLVFIILHEKGHNFYKTEHKADWYAIRGMWLRGYNKSQIGLAPLLTLSKRNKPRKKRVIYFLIRKLK